VKTFSSPLFFIFVGLDSQPSITANMFFSKLFIQAIGLFVLLSSTSLAYPGAANINNVARGEPTVTIGSDNLQLDEQSRGAIVSFFSTVENIPDSVLEKGDEALNTWLINQGYRPAASAPTGNGTATKRFIELADIDIEERDLVQRDIWKTLKCIGAFSQLIITTAIPAAKIFRIKRFINELGGIKQTVQLLLGATSWAEKVKAGGQVFVLLVAELTGITSVKSACF